MSINIAVAGIGGVGGYYGGLLAHHYRDSETVKIHFISRGQNLKVLSSQGLKIKTLQQEMMVYPRSVTDTPANIGPVDYLFCTTKSYDLPRSLQELTPLIGPDTVILPLLNGADITERIRQQFPHQEVWYGCVYIGAQLSAPGVVTKFTERDQLWFGHPSCSPERQVQLLQLLTAAGISAANPPDILQQIWKKFFLISLSATLTTYYDQSIGEVLAFHRSDYELLGHELYAIAQAQQIWLPEDIVQQVIDDQLKMPYDSTTSMHRDWRNGKPTEVDTLTGYVVESGKKYHIPVPTYESMYQKLKTR